MEKNRKTVFITGGTSGIGLAIAKKYLQEGFFAVVGYCNGGSRLQTVKRDFFKSGFLENRDYMFFRADVGNESELLRKLKTVPLAVRSRIQILINNAGILKRGKMLELSQSDWTQVFNVNVFGIINISKLIVTNCRGLTNIVNIGSIRGEPAISRTNNIAYSISKSTIPTLTAVMAKSFGPKTRVNAILPGTIDTPQRQGLSRAESKLYGDSNSIIKRLGKPEEVANLCYFITSDNGSYITGASFVIDGGYNVNYIK